MLQKKNLLTILMIALFSFFIAGGAAAEFDEGVTPDHGQNKENLARALAHAEEALAAAKAGDGKAAYAHTKESVLKLKDLYPDDTWAAKHQKASSKIRVGGIKAKKGDLDAATNLIESGVTILKSINL